MWNPHRIHRMHMRQQSPITQSLCTALFDPTRSYYPALGATMNTTSNTTKQSQYYKSIITNPPAHPPRLRNPPAHSGASSDAVDRLRKPMR